MSLALTLTTSGSPSHSSSRLYSNTVKPDDMEMSLQPRRTASFSFSARGPIFANRLWSIRSYWETWVSEPSSVR